MDKFITYQGIAARLNDIRSRTPMSDWMYAEIESLISDVEAVTSHTARRNPNWATMEKPILTVDFDGVISEYKHGWEGAENINEVPLTGAFSFLSEAVQHFTVMIFSSRCNDPAGIAAMMRWFRDYGLPADILDQLTFEPGKPSWYIHIDDRNFSFQGTFPSPVALKEFFKPWYYKHAGWNRAQAQSHISEPPIAPTVHGVFPEGSALSYFGNDRIEPDEL